MKHTSGFDASKFDKGETLYQNVGNMTPLVAILDKMKMEKENSSFGSILPLLLPGCCNKSHCAHLYLVHHSGLKPFNCKKTIVPHLKNLLSGIYPYQNV